MSEQGLPAGASITTIDGRRCTARPRAPASTEIEAAAAAATTTSLSAAEATTAVLVGGLADNNAGSTLAETSISSSTSTTSSSPVIINTSPPTFVPIAAPAQAVQVGDDDVQAPVPVPPVPPEPASASSPPAAALPSIASSSSPTTTIPPTSSTVASSQQTLQTPIAQSSQADNNVIALPADSLASSQTTEAAAADVSSSPPALNGGAGGAAAAGIFTTIGTVDPTTDNAAAEATDTTSTNSAVSAVPNPNSNAVQSTVAVAGGVIGGVVAISLVAFVVWWWRRRVLRKRRSTLLTPLDAVPSFDRRDEKGPYVINRGSIGPTPMVTKIKAAMGYNVKKFRGRVNHMVTKSNGGAASVNLDRGNSQFMDPVSTHSRDNSAAYGGGGANVTTKDRFVDWWSRLTADMKFNWRLRNRDTMDDFAIVSGDREKRTKLGSQPDFLTLLGMDDGELDREAQRRRASISRKNGSTSSADNFLGGLSLNFGNSSDNPFSDANALAHNSAQPAPLVVSQSNNPFSDANAIRDPPAAVPKPNTYVADIRRSRGQSVGAGTAQPPNGQYNRDRDSGGSVGSFTARRNKFRSDPFDLERPELLAGARAAKNSMSSSTAGTAGSEPRNSQVRRPPGAHTRNESFTSKYSSGISMGDWSDPGPDVGPAASRWDGPEPRESPTQGWRDRLEKEAAAKNGGVQRKSDGSERVVGKAM